MTAPIDPELSSKIAFGLKAMGKVLKTFKSKAVRAGDKIDLGGAAGLGDDSLRLNYGMIPSRQFTVSEVQKHIGAKPDPELVRAMTGGLSDWTRDKAYLVSPSRGDGVRNLATGMGAELMGYGPAVKNVKTPAARKAFDAVIKGHELAESQVKPVKSFRGFGHLSPDVLLREHNMIQTLPPNAQAAGDAFRAMRAPLEAAALKETTGFQYGQGVRLSRHARKHLTNMHESAALRQTQEEQALFDKLMANGSKTAASRDSMTVPQSRSGRRPMSVETLLTKDEKGELFKKTAQLAFFDELSKIASVQEFETALEKAASDPVFQEMTKDASFRQAIKSLGSGLAAKVSPNARMMQAAATHGLGDVASAAAKASTVPARAARFAKAMRSMPAERVRAAGHALNLAEEVALNDVGARMGGTSLAKRLSGSSLESIAQHVGDRSTLGFAGNPVGILLGGALEGATRQGGRELARVGHQTSGAFMQDHARKAGIIAETAKSLSFAYAAVPFVQDLITKLGGAEPPVLALFHELSKVASVQEFEATLERASADPALQEMMKDAAFMGAIRNLGANIAAKVSPNARMMQAATANGLGDVAGAAAKASAPSARATAFGKNMRMMPAERVQAAGHTLAAGEGAAINATGARMGATSMGQRMVGGATEGAAHHVNHKSTLGLLTNPLGVPFGGAIEGATRQGGRELARAGHQASGQFLQNHAGKAGVAGEIAGLAGLGTVAAAPLSGAGALGTAALKGLGLKGGLIGAVGQYGAHVGADAVGTAMQTGMAKAPWAAKGLMAKGMAAGKAMSVSG